MALNETPEPRQPHNPGPSWGFGFLRRADAVLPRPVFAFLLGAGAWAAVALMPAERRHSRGYLSVILGRPASLADVWRHFFSFARTLMVILRVGAGRPHRCRDGSDCTEFRSLMASGRPALLGTFHLGHSDLLGFMLGDFGRRVAMIRQRVGNSGDTLGLSRFAGPWVTMIWVNDADNLVFALKDAVASGVSVAMKCDRLGFSSKLEPFDFLGGRRLFPFTIYHLSVIFRLPVVFCVGTPGSGDESLVHGSPVFAPDDGSRESNFRRARVHFQEFLLVIESLLRKDPFAWFNFIPLNPVAPESPSAAAG